MSQRFAITKELLNSYYQAGLTVNEMADAITKASGYKCSQGKVKQACTVYGFDLRRKPLKSPFVFGDVSTEQTTTEEREGELNDSQGVRF